MQRADVKKMGARLKALRVEADMTQAEVAAACGVSRRTWMRWEGGQAWPDPGSFCVLMTLFEANYRYLVGAHDARYFVRADMIDAEIWHLWHALDSRGRQALKEMARWLLKQTDAKLREKV